jgi:hypothetical protein
LFCLSPQGKASLVIDTVTIGSNGKFGIYLEGDTGPVVATITNDVILANGDVGLMVEQGGGTKLTTETIQFNDIKGNNTSTNSTHIAGGVLFNTSSTLSSFIGNKVHSNIGDGIGFNAQPNGGGLSWVINPPSAACDNTANSLYCYGTTGVGLIILQPTVTVDARHVFWSHNPPTSTNDFSAPAGTVSFNPACSAITTCP